MKIEDIYKLMKEKGQRITRQKKIILSAFIDNPNKLMSVNQVLEVLPRIENINNATVYRNIHNLSEMGILESLVDEAGITKYVIRCSNEHHHHLICLECGKIISISCEKDRFKNIANEFSFEESYHALEIYGKCKECAEKQSTNCPIDQ